MIKTRHPLCGGFRYNLVGWLAHWGDLFDVLLYLVSLGSLYGYLGMYIRTMNFRKQG